MAKYTGYVDANYLNLATQVLAEVKERSYAYMELRPGYKVLDVGCGTGTDTVAMAHLVGETGQVVGVDHDNEMVSTATSLAERDGVSSWVEHKQGDATSLPCESDTFDAVRSERLFIHVDDPTRVLAEMVRVTRLGGNVVVADGDWGTLSIDTPEIDVERKITRFMAERFLRNGYSGRKLFRMFKEANLADVTFEMFNMPLTQYAVAEQLFQIEKLVRSALEAGMVMSDEAQRWRDSLEQADAAGTFFCCITGILISGRKAS